MKTLAELKQVKKIVMHLLETDERTRNDDKWLTYRVMRQFTNIYIPFEDFSKMPSFESIKRSRAYIQNTQGMFPPTDIKVLHKRGHKEDTLRQHYGENK